MHATKIQNLLQRGAAEQAADACTDIAEALERAKDGKQSVSLVFKFTKTSGAIFCTSNWGFSARVTGDDKEDSEEIEDPTQPKLPGVTMSFSSPGQETVTLTSEQLAKATERFKASK